MSRLSATEARRRLPDLLDRVEHGEEITITRHGRPVAVLLSQSMVRARRATEVREVSDALRRQLHEARGSQTGVDAGLDPAYAEELAAAVRAERDTG